MSIMDSLFVGLFGMAVVFLVLVGLSLLLRLQSALTARFFHKKPAEALVQETPDAVIPSVVSMPAVESGTEKSFGGVTKNTYVISVNNTLYNVEVNKGGVYQPHESTEAPDITPVPQAHTPVAPSAPRVQQAPAPRVPAVAPSAPPAAASAIATGAETVTAPAPGTVVEIKTAVGAKVKCGDTLLLLEAMKMENEIVAPHDGTVAQVLTSKGAAVVTGMPLVILK